MPSLRNSIIGKIISHLNYGEYCIEDFEYEFPDSATTLATITFRAVPAYFFQIVEDYAGNSVTRAMASMQGGTRSLQTIEQPGAYKNHEKKVHETIEDCIERIPEWIRRIRQDLVAAREKYNVEIDEITANFQKHIDAEIEDPESYFNESEKCELLEKLNKLQSRVEELEKKFSLPEEKTKNINAAIEKSKSDIDVYPKGVWYRTAGNKIISTLKKALATKEGREALLELTKKLLS